jgi:protein gp37
MAENSGIEWTNHTFNPWIGCTKVSPACDHCYAEQWNIRYEKGVNWGPKAPRRRTSEKNWNLPLKWDKQAAASGQRPRVFCASLADVFDNQVDPAWREDLWALIRATPNLDWLLLTKRAPNIKKMLPADWGDGYHNVWLGTTVENQEEWYKRGKHLTEIPAAVRFLSCEPLLGRIDYGRDIRFIDWIIAGGESGPQHRHAEPDWFRAIRDQCVIEGVSFLFKQWEGKSQPEIKKKGRKLDGFIWNEYPTPRKSP